MKKTVLFLALMLGVNFTQAQIDKELEAITPLCSGLDTVHSTEGLKTKVAEFTALKDLYPASWMAAYYFAYVNIQLSYNEPVLAMKDVLIDNAEAQLGLIEKSCPLKDELFVMKALIANARIGADPENRWQKYGKLFEENLKLAKEVNENNPHIYLLKGIATYYTPKMFGGGPKNAKSYMEKAQAKYELVTSQAPDQPYWWGKATLTYFNQMIEQDLK